MGSEGKGPVTIIDDANVAAFLSMKGVVILPYIKNPDSSDPPIVAWEAIAEEAKDSKAEVRSLVNKFFANEVVGVNDFVRSLKTIRSGMYNLKSISNQ